MIFSAKFACGLDKMGMPGVLAGAVFILVPCVQGGGGGLETSQTAANVMAGAIVSVAFQVSLDNSRSVGCDAKLCASVSVTCIGLLSVNPIVILKTSAFYTWLGFLCSVSQFIRDLTKGSSTSPSKIVVQQWLHAMQQLTGTEVPYTTEVYKILVKRANCVNAQVQKLSRSGGRQAAQFLSKQWNFIIPPTSIIGRLLKQKSDLQLQVQESNEKVCLLEMSHKNLMQQVAELADRERNLKEQFVPMVNTDIR